MRRAGYWLGIIILTIPFYSWNKIRSIQYNGEAYNIESGKLCFRERHEEFLNENNQIQKSIINFLDHETLIVRKQVDYTKDQYAPDFEQEDLRDGYIEGARKIGNEIELYCKRGNNQSLQSKKIKIPSPAVIDGGFNRLLKDNWEILISGQTLKFYFAVPSRLDYFAFNVYFVEAVNQNNKSIVIFRMEPDSFLLKNLVSPINLQYDSITKRLIQFEGITTINGANGRSLKARIVYPLLGP